MDKEKGGILAIIISILVALLVLGAGVYFAYRGRSPSSRVENTRASTQLIGGDTDEHGCLIAAGYSWCEVKQKCLRIWEEPCQAVACPQEAKICPDGSAVGRIGPDCEFAPCPNQNTTKENVCIVSGGKVVIQSCYCSGTQDFYNSCAIGGCTCTPDPQFKRDIKVCDCGGSKCWDGAKCVFLQNIR